MVPERPQHIGRVEKLRFVVLDLAGPDESRQGGADEHAFAVLGACGLVIAMPIATVPVRSRRRSRCSRLSLRAGGGDKLGALHVAQGFAVAIGFREFDLVCLADQPTELLEAQKIGRRLLTDRLRRSWISGRSTRVGKTFLLGPRPCQT